ncbi:MAG: DUF1573 domain-containing protein, partial [Deltaproteobacteria bacterium]
MTEFDKVIPPGGEGKVKASFDTTHYKGPTAKSIQVITNDASKNPVVLQLKAEITTAIDVQPSDSVPVQGRPFDILAVKADPSLAVTVRSAAGQDGRRAKARGGAVASGSSRYVVTITPKETAPVGRTVAAVTLTTN